MTMINQIHHEGWTKYRVKDVLVKFQNGYAFSAKGYELDGTPIITMGNIGLNGKFKTSRKANYWNAMEGEDFSQYIVHFHNLIMAMTDVTPTMELIGRACIVSENKEFLLNQRVGLITVNEKLVNKYYLAYYTNHESWRSYCISSCGLAAQANLGTFQILNGRL